MRQFQAFRILDQDIVFCSFSNSHHDSGRRGKAQSTRTCNHQDCHGSQKSMGKCFFSTKKNPRSKGQNRNKNYCRDKDPSDFIRQLLYWSFAALSFLNSFDYLGKEGFATNFFSLEMKAAFLIDCACKDCILFFFLYWNRFARNHTFIDKRATRDYIAVYWDFFAWSDDDFIAFLDF